MYPLCNVVQEDTRQLSDRNGELSQQLHNMSATLRQLEAENARLAHGHATLTVEMEVRAAEARAARGEAAELAADRARLIAELQAIRGDTVGYSTKATIPSMRSNAHPFYQLTPLFPNHAGRALESLHPCSVRQWRPSHHNHRWRYSTGARCSWRSIRRS